MHGQPLRVLGFVAALLLCVSCQQPGYGPGGHRIGEGRYDGPPVTVDVLVQRYLDEPQHIAVVEIIAPTGGWEAALDHAEVVREEEDEAGVARLYVTLQGPGEDEIVTQALETHHITFRSEEPFEEAEVVVRHYRRGQVPGEYLAVR